MDIQAYAKINLTLDVLDRRTDGYHIVKMIMQNISLYDNLSFSRGNSGIEITTNHPHLPTGPSNLVYKAAELLFNEFNLDGGLEIFIDKQIPVAAGLAGGSTNAAATLVAINKLWGLGLTKDQLATRGAQLGADIPFCIKGGTQLATGIGTQLKELPTCPKLYLVVVNPPLEVSTAQVYQNLTLDEVTKHPETTKVIKALEEKNKKMVINNLSNLLELTTFDLYQEVATLKDNVESLTNKALMSGSGPTVLGFVKNKSQAKAVQAKLQEELSSKHRILVAQTVNHGLLDS
ncbi:4-diphosphocytidyl-2C-methyl-D-erythritol kinase [Halobacteroides halobius DSM 5150]|uniref:4-diphosphocytidyl-2-C-methyl-D-erythritol kinase n=1 Tax=Halobacteroides halobius (strain ATCC 35273 / DSM 5150 / MD-1) TaxID=748449 RepID=L0K4A5_HALHC|nr:4-(cytidine 5'-diphospho)-2-C-methyl-D-erythritol kinase [Halobacteroides halobius]AGB40112.1 4-diphosphocytidyl-2C-methyl-D-erythritol kinase [Halobacteroides halobius DSM 5150]